MNGTYFPYFSSLFLFLRIENNFLKTKTQHGISFIYLLNGSVFLYTRPKKENSIRWKHVPPTLTAKTVRALNCQLCVSLSFSIIMIIII